MIGAPLHFDFEGDPPEPDWLVEGLIERGTVTVLSGDSGVGKSIIYQALTVALAQRQPWLGRATHGQRSMVIDEENFRRVVHTRLRGFGMTNEDRPFLRYFLRKGVTLGEDDWLTRTLSELDDFEPDLLVIDTAAAATAVDLNDNTSVARLYASALRPLAETCAVLLLHHERKPQGGERHAGHAMMGARQWAGQADGHIALEKTGELDVELQADGSTRERYPIRLEVPKSRDGSTTAEAIAIVSARDTDGKLQWMRVEGDFSRRSQWRLEVVRALEAAGGELSVSALAEQFRVQRGSDQLRRGLESMRDRVDVEGDVVKLRGPADTQTAAF